MNKRVLVTGGAGFIGSNVVRRLLCEPRLDGRCARQPVHRQAGEPARLCICTSPIFARPKTAALVRDGGYDVIVHFAAQIDVRQSVNDPIHDANTNVIGGLNLPRSGSCTAERTRTAARIVFASTGGAIYGDLGTPPNVETTRKEPDSPYAIAKLATEYYLGYYSRIHGLEAVSLRFGNVYGPRQDPHGEAGVVAIFSGRILAGAPLLVFGDGEQTRDYVNVTDVAEATFAAATVDLQPAVAIDDRAFNIGTGVGTSVLDLASTLRRRGRPAAPIEFGPERPGELRHSAFLAIDKARATLGWSPRISLAEGLAQTYSWFASRAAVAAASGT